MGVNQQLGLSPHRECVGRQIPLARPVPNHMPYDLHDTIAAIGTTSGGAARGMIRVSGPHLCECLETCFFPDNTDWSPAEMHYAAVLSGMLSAGKQQRLPCELYYWPTEKSYSRQPTAEFHTLGSPPLLEGALSELTNHGARLAEPGEFTLRAFLAGRIDLTQAEAVLGVIDAPSREDLDSALAQLAGGLSRPLQELREELLKILAELEAGLDFVEEDIQFISRDTLQTQLADARKSVADVLTQMASRSTEVPDTRVVLTGLPNAGKSSLFNALVQTSAAEETSTPALVSQQSGTTRDYVTANVRFGDHLCQLVDTAGIDHSLQPDSLEQAAQTAASEQSHRADLQVLCVAVGDDGELPSVENRQAGSGLVVITKCDLLKSSVDPISALLSQEEIPTDEAPRFLSCSMVDQPGIAELTAVIGRQLEQAGSLEGRAVASTAARCAESLNHAHELLTSALNLAERGGGEELIAAEVRVALVELGRIVGAVYTDDILDRIFSQFCIGK